MGTHEPALHTTLLLNHSVTELRGWRKDYDLEQQGRPPAHPMRYDREATITCHVPGKKPSTL